MLDTINGFYELLGGLFIAMSCLRVYRDKRVQGVSLWHVLFFNSWGFFNLIFYPALGQWWSFVGGIGVVAANTTWSAMIVYYKWFYRQSPTLTANFSETA